MYGNWWCMMFTLTLFPITVLSHFSNFCDLSSNTFFCFIIASFNLLLAAAACNQHNTNTYMSRVWYDAQNCVLTHIFSQWRFNYISLRPQVRSKISQTIFVSDDISVSFSKHNINFSTNEKVECGGYEDIDCVKFLTLSVLYKRLIR